VQARDKLRFGGAPEDPRDLRRELRRRERLELAQQPRLADAGLAGHEHRGRRATLGPLECRLEARELRGAIDEVGAGDARRHMAIMSARQWRGEGGHANRGRRARGFASRRRAFSRGETWLRTVGAERQ
jgi:hypothetical protein